MTTIFGGRRGRGNYCNLAMTRNLQDLSEQEMTIADLSGLFRWKTLMMQLSCSRDRREIFSFRCLKVSTLMYQQDEARADDRVIETCDDSVDN